MLGASACSVVNLSQASRALDGKGPINLTAAGHVRPAVGNLEKVNQV